MKTVAVVLSLLVLVTIVQDVYSWPEGRRPDGERRWHRLNGDEQEPRLDLVGQPEFEPRLQGQEQRPDSADLPALDGRPARADRSDRADRPNRAGHPDRAGLDRAGRLDRPGRPDSAGHPDRAGRPDHAGRPEHNGRPDRKQSHHHKRAGKLPVCNLAVRRPNMTDPFVLCTAECPNNTECTPRVRGDGPNLAQVSFCLPKLCTDNTQCEEGTTCASHRNETVQRCYRNRTRESHEDNSESAEDLDEESEDASKVESAEDNDDDDNESAEHSDELKKCTHMFKRIMKRFRKGRNGNSERPHRPSKQRQRRNL